MTKPGRNRARAPTRDHIFPKTWGGTNDAENIRIVCRRCNMDRALAGHCIGALACARSVARSEGATAEDVLRYWRLPRLKRFDTPSEWWSRTRYIPHFSFKRQVG